MLTVVDEDRLDLVFAALANRRRRALVLALATHPASIAQLAAELGMSLPAIHPHVAALEAAGLVRRRKSGRVNYLAITRSGLALALDWLESFNPHWGSDEDSLENYVAAIASADGDSVDAGAAANATTETDPAPNPEENPS